jgi:hypothetical protein
MEHAAINGKAVSTQTIGSPGPPAGACGSNQDEEEKYRKAMMPNMFGSTHISAAFLGIAASRLGLSSDRGQITANGLFLVIQRKFHPAFTAALTILRMTLGKA